MERNPYPVNFRKSDSIPVFLVFPETSVNTVFAYVMDSQLTALEIMKVTVGRLHKILSVGQDTRISPTKSASKYNDTECYSKASNFP